MAQYVVFATRDVPALGQTGEAVLYRGDHVDEGTAADAGAAALGVQNTGRVWVALASALTRYIVTTSSTYDANVG